MSDETKTEGDYAITLAMANAWRKGYGGVAGRRPISAEEWNGGSWTDTQRAANEVLAWVRANLVAPAVAEAKKREREDARAAVDRVRKDRDKLRAWADEWNSKACELQHQLNRANESLAAEKVRAENLAKGLREANRLGTDYTGEIRELRAKRAELEARLEVAERNGAVEAVAGFLSDIDDLGNKALRDMATKPALAALPKVGETVEVRDEGESPLGVVYEMERLFGLGRSGSDVLTDLAALGWQLRRVQPQPSESAPEAAPVEPAPRNLPTEEELQAILDAPLTRCHSVSPWGQRCERPAGHSGQCGSNTPPEDMATHPKRAICGHGRLDCEDCQWVGGFSKKYQQANKYRYAPTNERLRPAPIEPTYVPSTSEPAPEDVATPELDGVQQYTPSGGSSMVTVSEESTFTKWMQSRDVRAAYRRDLTAAIDAWRAGK